MLGTKQAQAEAERTALLQRQVDLARTGRKPLVQVPRAPPVCAQRPEHPKPRRDLCCALQVCIPLLATPQPQHCTSFALQPGQVFKQPQHWLIVSLWPPCSPSIGCRSLGIQQPRPQPVMSSSTGFSRIKLSSRLAWRLSKL